MSRLFIGLVMSGLITAGSVPAAAQGSPETLPCLVIGARMSDSPNLYVHLDKANRKAAASESMKIAANAKWSAYAPAFAGLSWIEDSVEYWFDERTGGLTARHKSGVTHAFVCEKYHLILGSNPEDRLNRPR